MMINDKTQTGILRNIIFGTMARATNDIIIGVATEKLSTGLASGISLNIAYYVGFRIKHRRETK